MKYIFVQIKNRYLNNYTITYCHTILIWNIDPGKCLYNLYQPWYQFCSYIIGNKAYCVCYDLNCTTLPCSWYMRHFRDWLYFRNVVHIKYNTWQLYTTILQNSTSQFSQNSTRQFSQNSTRQFSQNSTRQFSQKSTRQFSQRRTRQFSQNSTQQFSQMACNNKRNNFKYLIHTYELLCKIKQAALCYVNRNSASSPSQISYKNWLLSSLKLFFRMEQTDSRLTDFHEISSLGFLLILVNIFQFLSKVDEDKSHYAWRPKFVYGIPQR